MVVRDKILASVRRVSGINEATIEAPENKEFGDYASNIAMQLFPKTPDIQNSKTPKDFATKLIEKLKKDGDLAKIVDRIEVAGAGFINFYIARNVLTSELEKVAKKRDEYGSSDLGKGKTVVIDYSSPNIAKNFGIGHLRSTIIGQALYNLYSFLGYKTIGDNHLGDWGTQFGAILAQISNIKFQISNLSIDKLEKLYVEFNKKADEKPEMWDEAREWFKKLEDGDKRAKTIWKKVKEISLKEFDRIYELLGVKIDYAFGESFYEDKMPAVIEEVRANGLSKHSEGAEVIELGSSVSGVPAMILKSDGTTTYTTRDLATLKFRIEKWNPSLIIYEVGSEQTLYFKQLFAVAKLLSWVKGRELVHVAHGLIRFPEGKMSTRRGQTIKLEELLNESVKRASKIIEKSKTSRGLSKSEKEEVAKVVGIGAVKYFDLMHHPKSDIIFNWEKMFVLEGNSAPYLQYTVARTQSVLAKSKIQNPKSKNLPFDIGHLSSNAEELAILRTIIHFTEVVEDAAENFSPNLLCNYLFDLASKFNLFYNRHRILDAKSKREFRVSLTAATGQILKNGLNLLGIVCPDRM